jgi:hypothetical protein
MNRREVDTALDVSQKASEAAGSLPPTSELRAALERIAFNLHQATTPHPTTQPPGDPSYESAPPCESRARRGRANGNRD